MTEQTFWLYWYKMVSVLMKWTAKTTAVRLDERRKTTCFFIAWLLHVFCSSTLGSTTRSHQLRERTFDGVVSWCYCSEQQVRLDYSSFHWCTCERLSISLLLRKILLWFLFLRGQNALHTLAHYAKDNAGAIFEILRQNRPDFPINSLDAEDNTGITSSGLKRA